MEVTIQLTEKEVLFLEKMIDHDKKFDPKDDSIGAAIHQCIATAMFDEGEHET